MFFYIQHSRVFNSKLGLLILFLQVYVCLETYNYLIILMGFRKKGFFVCVFKDVTSCRVRILYWNKCNVSVRFTFNIRLSVYIFIKVFRVHDGNDEWSRFVWQDILKIRVGTNVAKYVYFSLIIFKKYICYRII